MKMRVDFKYQISAFGDYSDIKPTSDTMQFMLDNFKEYNLFPSIFNEIRVNPDTPVQLPSQRIALVSDDNLKQVIIASGRVDVRYEFATQTTIQIDTAEEMNAEATKFFSILYARFHKQANRLALNTHSLLTELVEDQWEEWFSRFTNPITEYKGCLTEWQTRLMTIREQSISDASEKVNVITSLKKVITVNDHQKGTTGIEIIGDINTIPQNAIVRFDNKDICEFSKFAAEKWLEIMGEIA